jgi:hypothetical protein
LSQEHEEEFEWKEPDMFEDDEMIQDAFYSEDSYGSMLVTETIHGRIRAGSRELSTLWESALPQRVFGTVTVHIERGSSPVDVILNGVSIFRLGTGQARSLTVPSMRRLQILSNGEGGTTAGAFCLVLHYLIRVPHAFDKE